MNIRRLLPLMLVAALLLTACVKPSAPSPSPAVVPPKTSPAATDAQEDLDAMLPVLDSLARVMAGEGEPAYVPEDPVFAWNALYLLGVNWADSLGLAVRRGGSIAVGGDAMRRFAAAAFRGEGGLPDVPDALAAAVSYDAGADDYLFAGSDMGDTAVRVDSCAALAGGGVSATVGLYGGDGARYAGIEFTLAANDGADGLSPVFPLCVTDAVLADMSAASVPAAAGAPAEPVYADDSAPLWRALDATRPMELDLDCDGAAETITVTVDDDAYTTTVSVLDGGATLTNTADAALCNLSAHLGDALADDGQLELYLCGDMASDDYITCVYRLRGGVLERAEFYGSAEAVNGRGLATVSAVVNVFGTYGGFCFYRMEDRFAFLPASSYALCRYAGDWDERKLTLRRDGFPAELLGPDGVTPATLLAGTGLLLVETDGYSYAVLEAADGTRYRAAISRAPDDWQWYVGGVSESAWFGELLYAG